MSYYGTWKVEGSQIICEYNHFTNDWLAVFEKQNEVPSFKFLDQVREPDDLFTYLFLIFIYSSTLKRPLKIQKIIKI